MSMTGGGSLTLRCPICERWHPLTEMRQLLPCLHMFCCTCITRSSKKVCLMQHCFSNTSTEILMINNCDYDMCPRKLSFYESNRSGNCNHELCNGCLEELTQVQPAVCPVPGCNESISDVDSADLCDGCRKSLLDIKFVITKCCAARYCHHCAEKKLHCKLGSEDGSNVTCPEGLCIPKGSRKNKSKAAALPIAHCLGEEDCEGIALNGFPSNGECEHDVCVQCLEKMIEDCQSTGTAPLCPNSLCRQPYSVDSVIALKALFPQRAKYFSTFALENQGYDVIKDETVSKTEISPDFTVKSRRMEVKCELEGSDESDTTTVIFDNKGNVADFIREIRRALKILPLDKVYGFYIRREDKPNDDRKPEEELVVDAKSVNRPISQLNLTSECVIVVDTSGIVQPKTPQLH